MEKVIVNAKLAKRLRRHVKMMALDVKELEYSDDHGGTVVLHRCGRSIYLNLKSSIKQNILGAK